MASITKVSGKHNAALSSPNSSWVIMADEVNLFEVPDWIPQPSKDPKTGVLTPVKPAEIETPAKVTWKIKDTSGKNVLNTFSGNVLDKAKMKINKKYSGSYGYVLEATNDVSKDKASTYVLGNCDPKIVTAQWSKVEGASVQDEINYGQSIYITLDTEGLNGDKLTFELYNKKDDKKTLGTVTGDCINGDITVKMPTIGGLKPPGTAKTLEDLEDFIIKVKNPVGVYIKKGSDEKVVTFKIKNKTAPEAPEVPTNITPLKVGEPDKAPVSIGILSLDKIKVDTKYDVCNDAVKDSTDDKNFWILEDKGKYYHWLRTRSNAKDTSKPSQLPITLRGADNLTFTATFKTILPIDGITVRVRDKENKYIFKDMPHPKKAKDALHEITFSSTNIPYKDSVQYFPDFELIFDYSLDGKSWTPLGSTKFCFYLTWEMPVWGSFDTLSTETMQITYKGKNNICETLLWIGCKQGGKLKTITEETLIDEVFKDFKTLKVTRRRESTSYVSPNWSVEGLGYWRNSSSAAGSFVRGLRSLLRDGEARCGEWTTFFQHILLTQGLSVGNDTIGICTEEGFAKTPYFPNYIEKTKAYKPVPSSYQFAVKNAIHVDIADPSKTSGDSSGQGNPKTEPLFIDHYWFYYTKGKRFFDASYGKTYNSIDSNLTKYCKDNINSVFLIDATRTKGSIETTKIHDYIRATKNLF